MPKIYNRLFPSGAEHVVYVASISDYIPSVWSDKSQLRMSTRNRTSVTKNVYVWNTHALAYAIKSRLSLGTNKLKGWSYIDNKDIFTPIWSKKHDTGAGQPIKKMPTHFTVSPFNTFSSNENVFDVNFDFHPLVNLDGVTQYSYAEDPEIIQQSHLYGNTVSYIGERIVWQSMIVPAFPVLITNSVPNVNNFGPCFAEMINLSVGSINSPVNVTAKYKGSKALLLPTIGEEYLASNRGDISYYKAKYPAVTEREVEIGGANAENVVPEGEPNQEGNETTIKEYEAYRTANIRDCMLLWEPASADGTTPWRNFREVEKAYKESVWFDNHGFLKVKILGMTLNLSQQQKYTATADEGRRAMFGPKYVAIGERSVTGSIEMFMPQETYNRTLGIRFPSYSLAMYFGGPFLFIMPNVDFQEPKVSIEPGGVKVSMNFIARAAPYAKTTVPPEYFWGYLDVGDFSEFLIPFDIVYPDEEEDTNNEQP